MADALDMAAKRRAIAGAAIPLGTTGAQYDAWWEKYWKRGVGYGELWDTAHAHRALLHLLESEKLNVNGKTILVPGCGRGYDAVAMAEHGGIVEGLDIAETAVVEAKAHLETHNKLYNREIRVTYKEGDFFNTEKTYDVGYDYTFLCAIHPNMRAKWGQTWAEVINAGGILVLVLFPIVPGKQGGPPWHVDEALARELLSDNFDLLYEERIPGELSDPERNGLEAVMIWRRTES